MRSFIFGFSALLLLAAAPASAAEFVTTSDTDFEPPSVVIVSPADGSSFDGTPDAVVPVTIEHQGYSAPNDVSLWIDEAEVGACPEAPPCTFEATLAPGTHVLKAVGNDVIAGTDVHEITIEVKATSAETESGSDTDTDPTGQPTGTGADTDATDTDATDTESDSSGSGDGDKQGCGCNAGPGATDVLGLALFALFAPWRRRRHA